MFKTLACVLVVAVVASNAQNVNSGSSNTGMNLLSSGSNVLQNDVQNVRNGAGYGSYYGYPGYQGYSAYAAQPYYAPSYGYDAAYGYGYAPSAGYGAAYAGYAPQYGYPGYGNVNSASSNTGANIMSSNSDVYQNQIQNVDRY